MEKREPSCTVGRNVKMEDGMEISLKKKKKTLGIKLPYDPAFPLLGVYPEETKTEKDIYPNVHCSTIYNRQDMEATYMPINRYMHKEAVVHIYNGILFSQKKEHI